MFNKIFSKFMAGHAFYSHKEQQQFEMALEIKKEKVLSHNFFSF